MGGGGDAVTLCPPTLKREGDVYPLPPPPGSAPLGLDLLAAGVVRKYVSVTSRLFRQQSRSVIENPAQLSRSEGEQERPYDG